MRYDILKLSTHNSRKFEFDCWVNAKTFWSFFFAYSDLLLPIGSDEITTRLQMWLNNPRCGHKQGGKFPIFFNEITIKASPPIYIFINCTVQYYTQKEVHMARMQILSSLFGATLFLLLDFLVFRVLQLESFSIWYFTVILLLYAYSMKLLLEILFDTLNNLHDLLLCGRLHFFLSLNW